MSEIQGAGDSGAPLQKTASAKEISKWSMVVAALWIGALSLVKGIWGFGLEMTDIIYSGLALAAVFSPVYLNIMLEKIRDIRAGGSP
jgi:hypothetical protein